MLEDAVRPEVVREPVAVDEEARFITHSRSEILAILRTAMRKTALVTAYFNQGQDFVLTSIVGLDAERGTLLLDLPSQQAMLDKLLLSPRTLLVTSEDGIKIKFAVQGLVRQTQNGIPGVAAVIPTSIVRMQRREFYRVTCPLMQPPMCRVLSTASGQRDTAEVAILDISCGGIAVIDNHPHVHFEKDTTYPYCEIELPGIGVLQTALEVRNSLDVPLRNGTTCKRSGCRFVAPTQAMMGIIQRYIMKLERDRKLRSAND